MTTPEQKHSALKARLQEALVDGSQEDIDRAWADYDDALLEWLDDQSHRGAIEADPDYDDLEARTHDALIGYSFPDKLTGAPRR